MPPEKPWWENLWEMLSGPSGNDPTGTGTISGVYQPYRPTSTNTLPPNSFAYSAQKKLSNAQSTLNTNDDDAFAYLSAKSATSAPKTPYTPKTAPKELDKYGVPSGVRVPSFLPTLDKYANRSAVPAEVRSGRWQGDPAYIIPNSALGKDLYDRGVGRVLYGNDNMAKLQSDYNDGYLGFNYWNSLNPWNEKRANTVDVGRWANEFMAAHSNEGRLPTTQDMTDLAYSQANPGTGPNGAWTERDWIENWYRVNRAELPPDWR